MKQEKVAALLDTAGHIAMDDEDAYTIDTKPHGHGDIHCLLHQYGIAQKWSGEGKKVVHRASSAYHPIFLVCARHRQTICCFSSRHKLSGVYDSYCSAGRQR